MPGDHRAFGPYPVRHIRQQRGMTGVYDLTANGTSRVRQAPLSYEQEPLWFLGEMVPDMPVDTECAMVVLPGELDVQALRDGLEAFVQRHEIWRTIFPSPDGRPMQVVQAQGNWTWSAADLSGLRKAEQDKQALCLAEEQVRQPFDLSRGPLVRALLVRLGDNEHRLFITLHRIIFDRTSLTQIFLPELHELYEAAVQGREDRLDEVDVQYADYATSQREQEEDEELRLHLKFWKEYLADAPTVLELPGDHQRPAQLSYRGGTLAFALGDELTARLRELGRQEQVTLRTTLTAAVQALLYRYTGQEDLLIGSAMSRREQVRLHRTMGCFVTMVVQRASLAGKPSVRELLRQRRRRARQRPITKRCPSTRSSKKCSRTGARATSRWCRCCWSSSRSRRPCRQRGRSSRPSSPRRRRNTTCAWRSTSERRG